MAKKSTMIELVQELEKLPQTAFIKCMIEEAKAGEYHDYKNKKYVCGKTEAYNQLMAAGHTELAGRIRDGEFDEEADQVDLNELCDMIEKNTSEEKASFLKRILGLDRKKNEGY